MKKFLIPFFILNIFFLTLTTDSYAWYPIIIKKADLGNPPYNSIPNKDINYHTNNIDGDPGIVCDGRETLSQTFNPESSTVTSYDPTTGQTIKKEVFNPYDVKEVAGQVLWGDKFYASPALVNMFHHLQGVYKTIWGDSLAVKRAFLSMDVNSIYGNSGIDDRATNFKQQKCYKGQRIMKALSPGSQRYYNELVAWKCGSEFKPATNVVAGALSGCTKVRLSDIAAAYDPAWTPVGDYTSCAPIEGYPIPTPQYVFYHPEDNCSNANYTGTDAAYPTPRPGNPWDFGISPPDNAHLTPNEACVLYHNVVRAADSGSLARSITIWDHNLLTNSYENPQTRDISMPRGAIAATHQPFVKYAISAKQTPVHYDVCAINNGRDRTDKPNRVSLMAKIINFFGTIIDTAQTYSGATKTALKIPLEVNLDFDQAFMNNFLTKKIQQDRGTVVLPGSFTQDSRMIDPGIVKTRCEYARMILPSSWQDPANNCGSM